MKTPIILMVVMFFLFINIAFARIYGDNYVNPGLSAGWFDDFDDDNNDFINGVLVEYDGDVDILDNKLVSINTFPDMNGVKIPDRLNCTTNVTVKVDLTTVSGRNPLLFFCDSNATSNTAAGHPDSDCTGYFLRASLWRWYNNSGTDNEWVTFTSGYGAGTYTFEWFLNASETHLYADGTLVHSGTIGSGYGGSMDLTESCYFYITWSDDGGGMDADNFILNFTASVEVIDTTPPVISNFIAPGGTNTSDTTPTITLDTDENAIGNGSTDNVTWFGFTTTGGTSHQWTVDASDPLEIGYPQNVTVNLTNEVGLSSYATLQFNITDGQEPSVILNKPDNSAQFQNATDNTFTLNFTVTDNHFATLDECNLTLDGIINETLFSVPNGTMFNFSSLTYSIGNHYWNVTCVDAHDNSNTSLTRNFTVNALQDCTVSGVTVYLDGLNQSGKYEYGSILNISANLTYVSTVNCNPVNILIDLDAPNYGVGYSVGINKTSFLYDITILRQNVLSDYNLSTSGDNLTITMDNRTDLLSGSINITGTDNPENLIIYNEGIVIAVLPGYLNSTTLTQKSFIYSSINYNSTNITYVTASTETIFVNISASGNLFYNITFQLWGFNIDEGNEEDYQDNFTNENIYFLNSNTSVFGFYDNMEDDNINDWWDFTIGGAIQQCNETVGNTDDYLFLYPSSGRTGLGGYSCYSKNTGDSNFDLKNLSKIKIRGEWGHQATRWDETASCNADGRVYITDDTNSVLVSTLFEAGRSGFGSADYNITMTKKEQDYWDYITVGAEDGPSSGTVDLSPLGENTPWYFEFRVTESAGTPGRDCVFTNYIKVYNIRQNGLSINRTYTKQSYEANHSFIVSDVVVNTSVTHNYTAAWLFVSEYVPDGTNIYYYLSADNGTTWQGITPSERNIFATWGNQIIFRTNLTTGNINKSPAIYNVRLRVIPATITDVLIDAGDDGDIDFTYNNTLNSTTSPRNVSLDFSEVFDYVGDFNSNENVLFPISITTGSEGLLQVSSLESKQNPNPIIMNVTPLEDCYLCKIGATFTGGILNFTSLALDFLGSWNYTALAHTPDYSLNASHNIVVRYSKFDCVFPDEVDYYEPFPIMSRNDKNVTPYGQEINYCNTSVDTYCTQSSIPIFNCTYLGYDEPIANFTMYMNGTQNGIDLWFDDGLNKSDGINISTTEQFIMQLNKTNSSGVWSWTDVWNVSLDTIYNFYPEINFSVYCAECKHG